MKIILVSDIFGINKSLYQIRDFFCKNKFEVFIIDPYKLEVKSFLDKEEAYETFINVCGHEKYYEILMAKEKDIKADYIVSFSAGASASWLLGSKKLESCKKILCFYPSQIRNNLNIIPLTPVKVFFAKSENTYLVEEVYNFIRKKQKVEAEILPYEHGFMSKENIALNILKKEFNL